MFFFFVMQTNKLLSRPLGLVGRASELKILAWVIKASSSFGSDRILTKCVRPRDGDRYQFVLIPNFRFSALLPLTLSPSLYPLPPYPRPDITVSAGTKSFIQVEFAELGMGRSFLLNLLS